ncbi:MAG: methyltransferase domain-containing protein [Oscillospiraceae bacterium]|nr:methyltransferase domain-containing protein [Oscillospiraceae bacterium]
MSYNSSVYNEDYYKSHCGNNYVRGNGWEEVFARQAARIVKELSPKTALDVGCAYGYLVEGLRDLGIEASGIDVSAYAISNAREDIRPFCSVKSATEKITEKYDLITCIEVIEHLSPEDIDDAIANMCNASDTIIFSSTPYDFNEDTHFSVNPPNFWAEKFAYNGFYHDISYDCSYISVQAMLFRRENKTNIDLVRSYESKLFDLWRENCMIRHSLNLATAKTIELEKNTNDNIQKINNLNEEIQKLILKENELQNNIIQEYEDQYKNLKTKYSDLLRLEYIKRDTAEEKLISARKRNDFLESELWKTKCELENKNGIINSVNYKLAELESCQNELESYQNELLIYKSFAESDAVYTSISLKGKLSHLFKRIFTSGEEYWAPVFNVNDYLRFNPDVREKIPHTRSKLLWHFMRHGMKEGRIASENFNVHIYRRYNPDVAAISRKNLKNAYYHYIEYGCKEQRLAR